MKKKIIFRILLIIFFLFIGFAIGRFGDIIGTKLNNQDWYNSYVPHHWIFGIIIIILGIIFRKKSFGKYLIAFGIGVAISDLNDLLHLRTFGLEPQHTAKFWSIE